MFYRSRRPRSSCKCWVSNQRHHLNTRLDYISISLLHLRNEKVRLHSSSQNTMFFWALAPRASCIVCLHYHLAWLFSLSGLHVIKILLCLYGRLLFKSTFLSLLCYQFQQPTEHLFILCSPENLKFVFIYCLQMYFSCHFFFFFSFSLPMM